MSRRARSPGLPGLLAACIVAAPVLVGVVYAAAAALGLAGVAATGFTTSRFAHVLFDHATWRAIGWTLATATAATAIATAAAVVVALSFRRRVAADRMALLFAAAPLPIPHIVAAAGAILVLSQSGFLARIGHLLGFVRTPADMPVLVFDSLGVGFALTLAWKEFPFLALVAFSILATRGVALEESARTLGAGPVATLRRVILPMLVRGLLPAVIAVFIFVSGSYEGAALLSASNPLPLPVLTLERYDDLDLARRAEGYVLTLIGLLVGAALVAIYELGRAAAERRE